MRVVDVVEFRHLLLLLREDLDDNNIPGRTKIRTGIMESLDGFFLKLKDDIQVSFLVALSYTHAHVTVMTFFSYQNSLGKVSFTMDIWSDSKMQSFLAMTAHWIARDNNTLELKSSLIAFHRIWGKHTGKNLAAIVLSLLDRAGATSKVSTVNYILKNLLTQMFKTGHFTLDNAANNKTMMKELKKLLADREIAFHADDNRIMCFPHVVNIATQRVLQALSDPQAGFVDDDDIYKSGDDDYANQSGGDDGGNEDNNKDNDEGDVNEDSDESESDDDSDSDDEDDKGNNTLRKGADSYKDACQQDPISLCRKVARAVRSSGKRRDEFDELVTNGNLKGWFQVEGQTFQVAQLQLLLDVKTRWDSTFAMVKRFIELQPVRILLTTL